MTRTGMLPVWTRRKSGLTEHVSFRNGLCVRQYTIPFPALAGKRFFFVSDLHIQADTIRSFCPAIFWSGAEIIPVIQETLREFQPDCFLFGGDLITDNVLMDHAFALFHDLPQNLCSLAIQGNWEKRHSRFPDFFWKEKYRAAGTTLLVNETYETGDVRFYGADDIRLGKPVFPKTFPQDSKLNCILIHNPDTLDIIPQTLLQNTHLILAGHTHGGQVRIPGFGALYCSTKKWKKFECGIYLNRHTGTRLIVSSGIGTSAVPLRIFSPPEVCCLTFSA